MQHTGQVHTDQALRHRAPCSLPMYSVFGTSMLSLSHRPLAYQGCAAARSVRRLNMLSSSTMRRSYRVPRRVWGRGHHLGATLRRRAWGGRLPPTEQSKVVVEVLGSRCARTTLKRAQCVINIPVKRCEATFVRLLCCAPSVELLRRQQDRFHSSAPATGGRLSQGGGLALSCIRCLHFTIDCASSAVT